MRVSCGARERNGRLIHINEGKAPEVEKVATAIARNLNQHQLDTGFAAEMDFRKNGVVDLEYDWREYVSTAIAAIEAIHDAIYR